MKRRVTPHTARNPRRGFTLIEMLLVIVIIGILAALLLPAIQSAQATARNAAVRSEIAGLEAAIANFKATFGIEPPSSITLCENSADWSSQTQSVAIIRRIWPHYDFTSNAYDFNRNGTAGESGAAGQVTYTGAESLVFFLGGVIYNGAPTGFSKNPTAPFGEPQSGEVRQGPFFEFVPKRLKPSPNKASSVAQLFPVYVDSMQSSDVKPYIYLSSYDGRGYVPSDIPAIPASPSIPDDYPLPGPYLVQSAATPYTYHKAKSFQIISPGADGFYSKQGFTASQNIYDPAQINSGLGLNKSSYDNITNLAPGKLAP